MSFSMALSTAGKQYPSQDYADQELQMGSAKEQTIFMHLATVLWHEMHNTYEIAFTASGFWKNDAYASFGTASSLSRQESLLPRGASLTFCR